jgi:hypothetical protein
MDPSKVLIIKNPEVVTEKRPGPNYFQTPLSEIKEWKTAQGDKVFGGTWYKNDKKAVTSVVVEKIFNDRLLNKEFGSIAKQLESGKIEYDENNIFHKHYKESGNDAAYFESAQHINKIDINSLYGAMGNKFFHLFKLENAIDITLSGQHLIRYLATTFDNFFRNEFWKDKRFFEKEDPMNAVMNPIVKIIETDSVDGNTMVYFNDELIKIQDFFLHAQNHWWVGDNMYGDWLDNKPTTYSYNTKTNELESKEVNYVMSHEVEKEMFRIEYEDTFIEVTADHSLLVNRNGKVIEVKPNELHDHDELIILQEEA